MIDPLETSAAVLRAELLLTQAAYPRQAYRMALARAAAFAGVGLDEASARETRVCALAAVEIAEGLGGRPDKALERLRRCAGKAERG